MQGMQHEMKTKEGPEKEGGGGKKKLELGETRSGSDLIFFTHTRFNKRTKAKVMRLDEILRKKSH